MPFQDQDGKIALPKLTSDGAVPVDIAATDEEVPKLTLLELRAIRIGLELLNKLEPGTLRSLAAELR